MKYSTLNRKAIKGITPGDDRHRAMITASKISATCNPSRSPYESYYSLWFKFRYQIKWDTIDQDIADFGHQAEPFLAGWFQSRHPELNVKDPHKGTPKTWLYPGNERIGATPDRVLVQGGDVIALLEIKTARRRDEWGAEGTSEIPAHYYDQVQLQMACTGIEKTYVQALIAGVPAEYLVVADSEHQKMLIDAAEDFLMVVDSEAEIDATDLSHTATYEAVREAKPWITEGSEIELEEDLAVSYIEAVQEKKAAETRLLIAKTKVFDSMGSTQHATYQGVRIATRRHVKKNPAPGDTPTLYPARKMPTIPEKIRL